MTDSQNIIITDNVFKRLEQITKLDDPDKNILRISVSGGGCSGFKYNYEMISEPDEDDLLISSNGFKVAIDPVSTNFMNGCTIDYVEDLGSAYFEVKNPNASSKCGCGSSFSI